MSYIENSYTILWRKLIMSYIENYMTLWRRPIYAAYVKSGEKYKFLFKRIKIQINNN